MGGVTLLTSTRSGATGRRYLFLVAAALLMILAPRITDAQGLTGALIGTVTDQQGAVIAGALVRLESPALIGGPVEMLTNAKGQMWFVALPPGPYVLEVSLNGFSTVRQPDILISAGATMDRPVRLTVADRAELVVVEGEGSRIDVRNPGFGTVFGPDDLRAIPTTRNSMFSYLRATPGLSPTPPSSATATTVSAFGSGTNENQFLIDGNNFTCPCNGIARSEPGVDFMREIQIQSVGASAEYGNVQGAVINVVMKQGSEQLLSDASYYAQPAGLTSQPVRLPYGTGGETSGYNRARYRDFATNVGGPALRTTCGSMPDISTYATTTASRGPIRPFPGRTSRTKSPRRSTGNLARSGSSIKVSTTSTGSVRKRRRAPSRSRPRSEDTPRCRP